MIDSTTTEHADDNTNIGEINSTILTPIFLRELGDTNDCADALPSQTNGFILWPDTADHGLDIYDPDIAFVYGPCAGPVTILLPELRKLGVKPPLLNAIDATASPT